MTTARTDLHRPSTIKPEEYSLVLSYSLPSVCGGWPVPSFGINCALDKRHEVTDPETGKKRMVNGECDGSGRCCVIALRQSGRKFAPTGTTGKCSVCGTGFVYGDVWEHGPSGEHIHIGHQCADKYELIADRREFERTLEGVRVRSAREHEKAMKDEQRQAYIDSVEGLRAAFETDHDIVRSIKESFFSSKWTSLTPKQERLVLKLYRESLRPKKAEQPKVPAVIASGRQTVEGEVVSVRFKDSYYGGSFKLTVKVEAEGGVWLAWGTCPSALLDAEGNQGGNRLKGSKVRFDAKLKQGRDDYFALFSRPTKAVVVEWAPEDEAEAA